MSDLTDTIKAIGEIITPLGIAWMAWQQNKQGKVQAVQTQKQDIIHREINGMQTQLISAEKSASLQEGNTQGRADLKQEQKDEGK